MSDAFEHVAAGFREADENFAALSAAVDLGERRLMATDTLLCQHERALAALRGEVERLRTQLGTLSPGGRPASPGAGGFPRPTVRPTAGQDGGTDGVQPSDLHAFLDAIPVAVPDEPELAAALRTVLAAVGPAVELTPQPVASIPWNQPLLLLCSARPERLASFLDTAEQHDAGSRLFVVGRRRDIEMAHARFGDRVVGFEYRAEGPFAADKCDFLPELADQPIGAAVFLDTGLWGDRLGHCKALLRAASRAPVYCFGADDRLYRTEDSPTRACGARAVTALLDWYNTRLVPEGHER